MFFLLESYLYFRLVRHETLQHGASLKISAKATYRFSGEVFPVKKKTVIHYWVLITEIQFSLHLCSLCIAYMSLGKGIIFCQLNYVLFSEFSNPPNMFHISLKRMIRSRSIPAMNVKIYPACIFMNPNIDIIASWHHLILEETKKIRAIKASLYACS